MKTIVKKVGIALTAIAAFFAIYIYGRYDPDQVFFPKCPFFWLTGIKCPGCGSQRALHHLLHLNFGAAIHYNACLVFFIPILVFLITATLLRVRYPKLYHVSHSPILSWSLLTIILIWWLLRNIFGW